MLRFQRQSFAQKLIYSWPTAILLLLLIFLLGRPTLNSYLRFRAVSKAYQETKEEREELAQKKEELEKRLSYISSPYGLEKELRRRFSLKKPDEEVAIIIDRPVSRPESDKETGEGFWQRITKFLTGFLINKE